MPAGLFPASDCCYLVSLEEVTCPGMAAASSEVTGVLVEGGVPISKPRAAHTPFKRAAGEEKIGPREAKIAIFL